MPVAPYMLNLDNKAVMAKNELGFMQFIIKPLWVTFNEFTADAVSLSVKNIEANIKRWEEISKQAQEEQDGKKDNSLAVLEKENEKQIKNLPMISEGELKVQTQEKPPEESKSEDK